MSVVAWRMVHDEHGAEHRVVTDGCDGPGCTNRVDSDDAMFAQWGSLIGFVDVDDKLGNSHWCSVACMKAWAAELVDPGPGDPTWLQFTAAEAHHLAKHTRLLSIEQCGHPECMAITKAAAERKAAST